MTIVITGVCVRKVGTCGEYYKSLLSQADNMLGSKTPIAPENDSFAVPLTHLELRRIDKEHYMNVGELSLEIAVTGLQDI